jgi:hypothetical protein
VNQTQVFLSCTKLRDEKRNNKEVFKHKYRIKINFLIKKI